MHSDRLLHPAHVIITQRSGLVNQPLLKVVIVETWQRIPVAIRATVVGVLVSSIGVYAWVIIGALVPPLWAVVIMGSLLVV